jgi:formylglycine-generating enzyme required for sulfatase activity
VRRELAAAVLLVATLSQAADWPADEYDPKPAKDDVVLPMPCGGAMAFRKVAIPSSHPLGDREIRVGSTDEQRGYLEGAHPAQVAGAFADGDDARYYLIGKYEVTQLQWDAVMGECAAPPPAGRLPKTGVGWLDAVSFGDRFTLWLRKNALESLPAEEEQPGFVRLPTEVEWEFAARGGIAVSESEFQERTFPMPDGINEYVWFSGDQSANGTVQPIGLKKPNPLGLHDVLGNVDEMVLDPFRLNKLDRLHGQAGGFVVRGSNFVTAEEDVRTSYRQEVPYYQGAEHRQSKTTGFRVVVVAPVFTSRARLQGIEDAWASLGATAAPTKPALGDTPLADPVDELGAIAAAATDPAMQKRLESLKLAFRSSFQARDEQRDRAAKARLRLGTFLCQKLKDDGLPIDRLKEAHAACAKGSGRDNERCVKLAKTVEYDEEVQYANLRYYADTIVGLIEDYDAAVLAAQLAVLKQELKARSVDVLVPVADQYVAHVEAFRKAGTVRRNEWLAECKRVGR